MQRYWRIAQLNVCQLELAMTTCRIACGVETNTVQSAGVTHKDSEFVDTGNMKHELIRPI